MAKIPRSTVIAIVAFLALSSTAGWWSWQQVGIAAKAERSLRVKQMQWKGVNASEPAPNAETAEALIQTVNSFESIVDDLRSQLGASRVDPIRKEDPPAQRADAFFVLAQFMERQRAAAKSHGVSVSDHAAFLFSDHLLNALWRTGPVSLTQVWRENPATKVNPVAPARNNTPASRGSDWFDWPESRSVTRSGILDTLAIWSGLRKLSH